MNKHVNKNKNATKMIPPMFVGPAEQRDGMPKEVATEMLCTVKMTGGLRRTLHAARATHYKSTLTPTPKASKLEARFRQSTWTQLLKWKMRAAQRREECQVAYLKCTKLIQKLSMGNEEEQTRAELMKAQLTALDSMAEQLDIFMDVAAEEMARRNHFVTRLAEVAPNVARELKKSLCPAV